MNVLGVLKTRCRGKHSFDTMAEASREMAHLRLTKNDLVQHRGMKWIVYRCPFCRKWHYTSHGTAKDQEFYARVAKEGANV